MSPLQTTWTRVLSLPNTSTYLFYSAISRNNRLLIDLKKFEYKNNNILYINSKIPLVILVYVRSLKNLFKIEVFYFIWLFLFAIYQRLYFDIIYIFGIVSWTA